MTQCHFWAPALVSCYIAQCHLCFLPPPHSHISKCSGLLPSATVVSPKPHWPRCSGAPCSPQPLPSPAVPLLRWFWNSFWSPSALLQNLHCLSHTLQNKVQLPQFTYDAPEHLSKCLLPHHSSDSFALAKPTSNAPRMPSPFPLLTCHFFWGGGLSISTNKLQSAFRP